MIVIALAGLLLFQCDLKHDKKDLIVEADTVKRPSNLSPNASLINIGEYDAPEYRWYEYAGVVTGKKLKSFYNDGRAKSVLDTKVFDDIHVINAYNEDGSLELSDLFQVFPMEQKLSIAKTDHYKITDWWGTNTIKIETANGAFVLVSVFNLEKPFNSQKNLGYKFDKVPTIARFFSEKINAESYRLGETLNISMKKTDQSSVYDVLIITPTGKEKMQRYKLVTNQAEAINTSLIRYYDPLLDRIYFVEDGYLELMGN